MSSDLVTGLKPQRFRPAFATRLLFAQTMLLAAGAGTSWLVATLVGPGIFSAHLKRAGVSTTPAETAHVEEAFASAMVVILLIASVVAMAMALAVSWFFTRRVQRSIGTVAGTARQIAAGNYRTRAASPGLGAEFDLLTTTINELAERLATVERTRGRMLSDLAHEMRTPLATMTAHLEAIEDGVRTTDAPTMTVLRSSTERLDRLASDISAVSKAEEGALEVRPRPVRAASVVRSAVTAAQVAADRGRIRLVEDVSAPSAHVLADPERLGQVLGNLLDNAMRHSSSGSRIVVSCRQTDRGWVELAVTDFGDGIAPEHLGHVFDRFYRADSARNRSEGGSGIGLTITRALVEAHGGRVTASSPGRKRGATFSVSLPALR